MGKHGQLTLSLDEGLDVSFADDLLSQFDLKREQLYSLDNLTEPMKPESNDSKQVNPTASLRTIDTSVKEIPQEKQGPLTTPPDSVDIPQSPVLTLPSPPPIPPPVPPEYSHISANDNSSTEPVASPLAQLGKVPPSITLPESILSQFSQSTPTSPASSPPATITDRTRRRQQNNRNLLRRSSAYLRQRFLGSASPTSATPALPTETGQLNNNDVNDSLLVNDNGKITTSSDNEINRNGVDIVNDNRQGGKPLKEVIPSSVPAVSSTTTTTVSNDNIVPSKQTPHTPAVAASITTATTTTIIPPPPSLPPASSPPCSPGMIVPPCQYPPKPLQYSPVDPPNDHHRSSFPLITAWRKKSIKKDPRRQSEPIISTQIKSRRSFFFT